MVPRLTGWMRRNSRAMALGVGGVLLGLVLRLPVFPYSLPADVANVMGAAFGAMFAVWGAAWVADRKERTAHLLSVQAIRSTVDPSIKRLTVIEEGLDNACKLFGPGIDKHTRYEAIRAVLKKNDELLLVTEELEKRLDFLKPLFLQLGGPGAVAYPILANTGSFIRNSLNEIPWATFYDDQSALRDGLHGFQARNKPIAEHARRSIEMLQHFARGALVVPDL